MRFNNVDIALRQGNKAKCRICEQVIDRGVERVVETLDSWFWRYPPTPQHHHIGCYVNSSKFDKLRKFVETLAKEAAKNDE